MPLKCSCLHQVKSSWLGLFLIPLGFFSLCLFSLSHSVSASLAACGCLWPGVARNTGAVIWTAGLSISKDPRRCEIWDTFHSTLPSFWQKESERWREYAARRAKPKEDSYLYWSKKIFFFVKGPWITDSVINRLPLTSFLNWLRERRANICHFDMSIMVVEPRPLVL